MDNTNEKILKSSIHYYCLHGLHRTVASLASEGIRMYPEGQTYRFYYGCALAFEGRVQEAIRELDRCTNDRDLVLGAILALLYCHKKCQVVDHDTIQTLEQRLNENKRQHRDIMLYYAGLFLLLSKEFAEADKYVELLQSNYPSYQNGKVLYGWLLIIHLDRPTNEKLYELLDTLTQINEPYVLIIRSKIYELLNDYTAAMEQLNQAIALYSRFLPAFIEKIKLHAVLKEFTQLVDTAFRALVLDKHSIEPQRYLIMYYLAWEGNEELSLSRLQDLISSLELREPKNGYLYYETSKLISRLAFRNQNILLHSFSLIERSVFLEPTNVDFVCELASQCLLLKRFQDAQRHYRNSSKLDVTNLKPMVGLLIAQLMEYEASECDSKSNGGNVRSVDIEKIYLEIDHLEEFNRTTGLSHELLYLCVKAYYHRKMSNSSIEKYLKQILTNLKSSMKGISLSLPFYSKLEVNQLVGLAEICLWLSPSEPLVSGQQVPVMLNYAREFVTILSNAFPDHKEVLYLSALVKYLHCEIQTALNLINRCLQHDSGFVNAHILMANISIYDRNFKTAHKFLENALIQDFQVRENISYILAKVAILKYEKKYDEALELLRNSLDLEQKVNFKHNDKISLHLQIADIYLLLKKMDEASQVIKDLTVQFQEPVERGRILISSARFYCSSGAYENALQTLRTVSLEQGADHYIRSRQMMAAIYLSKFKDRKQFTACYREILDQIASTQSHLMLGDAYMNILEPETAIDIYEQALKKNPKDYFLIRKVGQALIKAHFYERAVTYYKAAIKTSGQNLSFCYDLGHLLFRLNRYEPAHEVVNNALQSCNLKLETDLDVYIVKIKLMHLLAQVQMHLSGNETAIQTLKQAHVENQNLMRRLPVEYPDLLNEHKKFSINLCKQLADMLSEYSRDNQQALQVYKDTLSYDETNSETYLQMAKIELQNQNFELAHGYCTTILKHFPNLEEPILMMADITFRQGDFEGALNLYNELLTRDPTYYLAMIHFVEATRRFGKLSLVPPILEKAEKHSNRTKYESAFYYCKGLYEWHTGNINEAIKHFYSIRYDSQYGRKATYHIVEICINPDNQTLGGEVFDSINSNISTRLSDRNNSQGTAIKTAEILLKELKNQNIDDFDYHLLANFAVLARKQKNDTEYVLAEFTKLLSDSRYSEHVGLIYGTSTALMVLKQTPKARNKLKRIAKVPWNYSDAEYLEKCWLLLADIHIQSNKFDLANELLRRVLRYNRSCVKAYEYMGFIMEKEQSYRDAASNYEMAWQYSNSSNPVIGFKLAFNYMKAKRFVDAIDVAQAILVRYPDYPRIRKEILEKCRQALKA